MQKSLNTHNTTLIFLILFAGVLGISHSAIFVRMAQQEAHSIAIAAHRLTLAGIVMLFPALFITSKSQWIKAFQSLKQISFAAFFLAAHFALWITSMEYTSIANSLALTTLNPVWIAVINIILYRKFPHKTALLSILLCISGSFVITGGSAHSDNEGQLYGDLMALLAGLSISINMLITQKIRQQIDLLPFVTLCYIIAGIFLWIVIGIADIPAIHLSSYTWVSIIALTLASQVIGHSAFNHVLKFLDPTFIALCILSEPILASIFGLIYFQEAIPLLTCIGGVMILSGIGISIKTSYR